MLYLLDNLSKSGIEVLSFFRIFGYITFRAGAAAATAFFLVAFFGPFTIRKLKKLNATAACRYEGIMEEKYIDRSKDKTPSMGGILIVIAITIASIMWANLSNPVATVLLAVTVSLALLGFTDDYIKIARQNKDGISAKMKFSGQMLIATMGILFLYALPYDNAIPLEDLYVPFLKEPILSSPWVLLLEILVVVGASNAVNITDGKDGLSSGCIIFSVGAYAIIAYLCGHKVFANYLFLPYMPSTGEALVFSSAVIGACGGFLWHNCNPAGMFMGDTGSLALGGALGMLAVIVRQELLLVLIGGVFVMEIGSVMLQVPYFKLTHGKRIFLCTPIHHHFERKGWKENQIVVRFWILAAIFALLGLATMKLR